MGADPIVYQVYANTGVGDPINYTTPIATVSGLTFTTAPLNPGGSYRFAVRAMDATTGLVDQNLDCAVQILLSAAGTDVTLMPSAPLGLRVFALAGGSVRVEWSYLGVDQAAVPLGFHVYLSSSGPLSYATPQATVPYAAGVVSYGVTLTGLPGGAICTVGVRAYNAAAEEPNTATVSVVALASGPAAVDALAASTT